MFIGFYNPSVVLTYIGLCSSVFGITLACRGMIRGALICLMVSGCCDMIDGPVARKVPRSENEKRFGVQIDSLCDVICFGVFPAALCYNAGVHGLVGTFALMVYVLAAVIRLAFFNVQEEVRNATSGGKRVYYQGLPVTSVALILPVVSLLALFLPFPRPHLYIVTLMATAIAFVLNIPVKKLHFRGMMILGFIGLILLGLFIALGKRFAS